MHEFGHAIGLNHSDGFDIMRTSTPLPLAGGNAAEPYPDDANGARFLYPVSISTNVFASAQKFSGGSILATDPAGTINVCRRQAISVTYSVVNNGSTDVNAGFRIFIANSPGGSSSTSLLPVPSFLLTPKRKAAPRCRPGASKPACPISASSA